jgi:TPR repeat protein
MNPTPNRSLLTPPALCGILFLLIFSLLFPSLSAAKDETNIETLVRKADKGDGKSQLQLGYAYLNGDGVEQDLSKSEYYFLKALDKKKSEGGLALGVEYLTGQNFPQNLPKAVSLFERAADQGNLIALHNLGILYSQDLPQLPEDPEKSVYYLKKASDKKFAHAKYELARRYLVGYGVKKDEKKFLKLLTEAAKAGVADAQFFLGHLYDEGVYVSHNVKEAEKWYKKAADQGHDDASYSLKDLYEE